MICPLIGSDRTQAAQNPLDRIYGGAALTWFAFQAHVLYICSGTLFVPVHVYIDICDNHFVITNIRIII